MHQRTSVSREICLTFCLLLTLSIANAGGQSTAAAADAESCQRDGTRTVAQNSSVRVFTRAGETSRSPGLYACDRQSGRATLLERSFESSDQYESQSEGFNSVRLVGAYVAWDRFSEYQYIPECKAGCPEGVTGTYVISYAVRVFSVRSRAFRTKKGLKSGPANQILKLNRFGGAVWGESLDDGQVRLHAMDGGGARILDEGSIDPTDVRQLGKNFSWQKDGKTFTKPIHKSF